MTRATPSYTKCIINNSSLLSRRHVGPSGRRSWGNLRTRHGRKFRMILTRTTPLYVTRHNGKSQPRYNRNMGFGRSSVNRGRGTSKGGIRHRPRGGNLRPRTRRQPGIRYFGTTFRVESRHIGVGTNVPSGRPNTLISSLLNNIGCTRSSVPYIHRGRSNGNTFRGPTRRRKTIRIIRVILFRSRISRLVTRRGNRGNHHGKSSRHFKRILRRKGGTTIPILQNATRVQHSFPSFNVSYIGRTKRITRSAISRSSFSPFPSWVASRIKAPPFPHPPQSRETQEIFWRA